MQERALCDSLAMGDVLSKRCEWVTGKEQVGTKVLLTLRDGSCAVVDKIYKVVHLAYTEDDAREFLQEESRHMSRWCS
jgi:hypothetical protein